MVYEAWNKGRIDIEPVGNGAIRYCLEYIDKQVFGANTLYDEYGDFQPPFALFSKGIGESWIQKNLNHFNDYGTITFGASGKSYTLNPYYRRKYQFKTKEYITPYTTSVVNFAKSNKLDLKTAFDKRSEYVETKLIHKQVHNREPIFRVTRAMIDKEITRRTTKHNVDKRSKWYRDVTKALLKCDSKYLDSGLNLINDSSPNSSVVSNLLQQQDFMTLSTMPMRDRIALMKQYNRIHVKKKAVNFLTNSNYSNIISTRT